MKKRIGVIARIVEVLKKTYEPEKIILFGSHAYGRPTEESDIDLLIVKNTPLPFYKRLAEIRKLVSEARKGHAFEPIVVTPAELRERLERGDEFFRDIVRRGKVLHG